MKGYGYGRGYGDGYGRGYGDGYGSRSPRCLTYEGALDPVPALMLITHALHP